MTEHGGLLTEFISKTNPDKQNFPKRNRIVAGISDAVIIVETGKKGGSLITAELGNNYNKDVFAIPGRVNDSKSEGCNYLIRNNKAALINNAEDLLELMNWKPVAKPTAQKQRELFIELTSDEQTVVDVLQQKEIVEKPLMKPVDKIKFIGGVTILGSGNVCLVLNIPYLLHFIFSLTSSKGAKSLSLN